MTVGDHLASVTLLRKIDQLREKNVGQHVPLPQLVVVGDQSSGKSSLLESLTGIPFPRNLELCTRYATQITSRRDSESRLDVTIIAGPHASDEHQRDLSYYHPRIADKETFRTQFPEILKEVNARMGIRTDTSSSVGTVFSEDVLKIEICGPDEDYLTVIDVPGIFRNRSEGITTREDVRLVRRMVKKYIQDSRTIILAVLPSNVDIVTQEILTLAEDCDKAGERTLGVLTKPDLVKEQSAQAIVCDTVLGKKRPLTLGYYVVQSRGADNAGWFDRAEAEKMFLKAPWNRVPKDRLGIQALKARLRELLSEITRKGFPVLRREVNKQFFDCRTELEGLGPPRKTEKDCRVFLSTLARNFQDLVDSALNAQYSRQAVFEEKQGLRLITYVVNLTEKYRDEIEVHGHLRSFEIDDAGSNEELDYDEYVGKDEDENENENEEDEAYFLDGFDFDEFPVLENIITRDRGFPDPKHGIMYWTEQLYMRSRGIDLGTFSETILSSAFKEQSSRWPSLARSYLSHVIGVIHRFMVTALDSLCTDVQVREELWSAILDEVLKRYKAAMDQAMFLVSLERDKRPYTANRVFNENVQTARSSRLPEGGGDNVKEPTGRKNNVEQVKEEIHDRLWSYYQVARDRFVDNVYRQAVDHCLLTGPMSPLTVFTQDWVIQLEVEQLETITRESPVTRDRRAELTRKVEDLEIAARILRQ